MKGTAMADDYSGSIQQSYATTLKAMEFVATSCGLVQSVSARWIRLGYDDGMRESVERLATGSRCTVSVSNERKDHWVDNPTDGILVTISRA